MKISILTLFPEMFSGPFHHSIVKRAQQKGLAEIHLVNIRDSGLGKHKTVDDSPYGGGHGMILRVDVLANTIEKTKDKTLSKKEQCVALMSARGNLFDQKLAKSFATLKHLILICGHYEGVDQRIAHFIDAEISIGDFVLTGGEIPAMLVTDSVVRLLPLVLKENVTDNESFSPYLEYPQYTKPPVYKKFSVPDVLLSGHHKNIERWRKKEAEEHTRRIRPDLLKRV